MSASKNSVKVPTTARMDTTGRPRRSQIVPYQPKPIDTTGVQLSDDLLQLTERLAEHAHDVWAQGRLSQGWTHGPRRDDERKTHPGLVPYAELSEEEKQHDRNVALGTLHAIIALGYRIQPAGPGNSPR